jgi:hypothetical protein
MKKPDSEGNGFPIVKSQAEKFLLARHGRHESIARAEVKKLVTELQLQQSQLKAQHRELQLSRQSLAEIRDR